MLVCGCSLGQQEQKTQFAAYHRAEAPVDESGDIPAVAADFNRTFQGAVTQEQPVKSLLELRHHDVIIQSWDLSCGAAALATLL